MTHLVKLREPPLPLAVDRGQGEKKPSAFSHRITSVLCISNRCSRSRTKTQGRILHRFWQNANNTRSEIHFCMFVSFFLIWIANVVESKMLTYAAKLIFFRATKRLINANMHTTSETRKNRMQSKQNGSD